MKNKNTMKTILTLLIFTLATLTAFAQVDSISLKGNVNDSADQFISSLITGGLDHFTFKDIPIDSSLNHFVTQLKKQSFTVKKITDEDAMLTGRFTGEEVHILVQAASKTVFGVTVMYNEQTTWKAIKTQYENMKYMLTAKYGDPMEIIEKFDDSSDVELGLELYALSDDKYTYMTQFVAETGNGMIRLKISPDASLVINYVDTLNYLINYGKAYDDL